LYVKFLTYKLKQKQHTFKKAPSIWPTVEVETYRSIHQEIKSIVQQAGIAFCICTI